MDFLEDNLKFHPTITNSDELRKTKYYKDFQLRQTLINFTNSNKMTAIYLCVDIVDLSIIKQLLNDANRNSIFVFWYRDIVLLRYILGAYDFSTYKINKYFVVANPDDHLSLHRALDMFGVEFYRVGKIIPVIYESRDMEYIKDARQIINQFYLKRSQVISATQYSKNYYYKSIFNGFANFKTVLENNINHSAFKSAHSPFINKPAVIVATGPSLDKNIEQLKAYKNKAYILSCDASLSTLKEHHIVPDFIGKLEFSEIAYNKFFKDKKIDDHSKLVAHINTYYKTIAENKENVIIYAQESNSISKSMMNLTNRDSLIGYSGTSVAIYLASFAVQVGFDPIILIGQDLAYGENGVTHARDSEVKDQVSLDNHHTVWLKGNYTDKIASSYEWSNFLKAYESLIHNSENTFINATAGGAYINGTVLKELKDVLSDKANLPKVDVFNEFFADRVDNAEIDEILIVNNMISFIKVFSELDQRLNKSVNKVQNSLLTANRKNLTNKQIKSIYDTLKYVIQNVLDYIPKSGLLLPIYISFLSRSNSYLQSLSTDFKTLDDALIQLKHYDELLKTIFEENRNILSLVVYYSYKTLQDIGVSQSTLDNIDIYRLHQNYLESPLINLRDF